MLKHLIGNSIYQIIIIYSIVFLGEYWFPEPLKGYQSPYGDYVMSGRSFDWNSEPLYEQYYDTLGPSRHFANVFNVFVVLQIFNMLNARKINDELNIFDGILSNVMYIVIWFIIAGG